MLHEYHQWQWPTRHLLQLTDCHLLPDPDADYRGVQPYHQLARLLARYRQQPLPLVLTGDIAEDHSAQSYQRLYDLLHDWPAPVYLLPGNHDDLGVMQRVLSHPPFVFAHHVDAGAWAFILLDTQSQTPAGAFDPARQAQLAASLAKAATQQVWLFCHHQPKPIGGIIDTLGQQDEVEFNALIDANPHVKGLSHGHCHHGYIQQQAQWQIVGCPATSIQYLPRPEWVSVATGPQACQYLFADDGAVQLQFIQLAP